MDSISDVGSPSETATGAVPILAMNRNIGTDSHSRRISTVTEQQNMYTTDAVEIGMGRQEHERENSLEQQCVKRRRVEDQMSSLACPSSRFMLLISPPSPVSEFQSTLPGADNNQDFSFVHSSDLRT